MAGTRAALTISHAIEIAASAHTTLYSSKKISTPGEGTGAGVCVWVATVATERRYEYGRIKRKVCITYLEDRFLNYAQNSYKKIDARNE